MSGSINGAPGAQGYLASNLINMALLQIGIGAIGTTASAPDIATGVMHLNLMLAQWQHRRWLVPNLVDHAFAGTGQSVYAIGPGGDLNVPLRPDKIEAAYARLTSSVNFVPSSDGPFSNFDFASCDFETDVGGLDNVQLVEQLFTTEFNPQQFQTANIFSGTPSPIDYPLTQINSYEDYAGLGLKGMRSWPNYFFYNPAFPYGEFRPWPIPQGGQWEFHVVFKQPLPATLSADSNLNLPPEYWDAIMWSLAARMAPSYGQEASPTVVAAAKSALNTIRTANSKVPTLGMPAALSSRSSPFYWPGLQAQNL